MAMQRREQKLPREVLRLIIKFAAIVETRVVSAPDAFMPINARRRPHQRFGGSRGSRGGGMAMGGGAPDDLMVGLCIEDDPLPT